MALAGYLAFLGASCAYALVDWRRAWFLVIVCGVLQDPVRKLTPGTPVYVSFAVVVLYAAILFSARNVILSDVGEFSRRFPRLYAAILAVLLLLVIAGLNGLVSYGFDKWKVPLVSFFTYCVPLIAAIFGYVWLQREEMLYGFFRVYAAVTSVALIGSMLEYLRFDSPVLGMVAFEGDYIRHLPGIQIRMLSGIYRSPDVMAWHAGMLASIGIAMALRAGLDRKALIWSGLATWGFFNCMMAGRRKAIYFVVVFAIVFIWRYMRSIRNAQIFALCGVALLLAGIVHQIASREDTSIYARGAATTRGELAQRLEGGLVSTFEQFGLMGVGLGAATQGVHHLLGANNIGWQEGGLGKLAIEVGLPGLIAIAITGWIALTLWLRLTRIPDVPGSSQFLRATLFALVAANGAGFIASAQAYTDAILALTTGFLVGCLFASAALDERLAAAQRTSDGAAPQLTSAAPA